MANELSEKGMVQFSKYAIFSILKVSQIAFLLPHYKVPQEADLTKKTEIKSIYGLNIKEKSNHIMNNMNIIHFQSLPKCIYWAVYNLWQRFYKVIINVCVHQCFSYGIFYHKKLKPRSWTNIFDGVIFGTFLVYINL